MNPKHVNRRGFIKTAVFSAALAELAGTPPLSFAQTKGGGVNPLPRWNGFNLTDFNSPNPASRSRTSDDDLKWMVDWGFDFIRLPMAYPRYVEFDRSKHITPEEVCKINEQEVDRIEAFAITSLGLNWPRAASPSTAASAVAGTRPRTRFSWRGLRTCSTS